MKNIIKILTFIIFLLIINDIRGQYYSLGQDPASLRWKQIKTDNYRLIFPDDFTKQANKLANDLENIYDCGSNTLRHKPRRAPVLLHNRTIVPNAFVIWAPKRMEFFTCPSQSSYPQDWLKQLAIHENRHFVQMDKLNQGFTKYLSYLLGEQAVALPLGLYFPTWFMEGDAVCTETALSSSGRGRIPAFEMELRTIALQKRIFKYDKAIFGSYRDFVPDQYITGYHFVAMARKKYGAEIWSNAIDNIARKPFIITPLSNSLKKSTGLNKTRLYTKLFTELDSLWTDQDKRLNYTNYYKITSELRVKEKHSFLQKKSHNPKVKILKKPVSYTKYKYPAYINDSLIFAERSGIDDIPRFVLINKFTGREKLIYTPGIYSADVINVQGGVSALFRNKPGSFTADNVSAVRGLICWTEKAPDTRWEHRSYSVIKILNINTGKLRQLTRKSRYFSPAISPDGKKIIAVKVAFDNRYSLSLLDIDTGKEIKEIVSSYIDFYINPNWDSDNKNVVVVVLNDKGKAIIKVNTETGQSHTLINSAFTDISSPKSYGKYIIFNAAYSGIDNIYALDTANKEIYQVSSSVFGAYNPCLSGDGKYVIYSDYNATGFDIVEADFEPANFIPLKEVENKSIKLYKKLLEQESCNLDTLKLAEKEFKVKKYSKALNIFNFHSWAPVFVNADDMLLGPGISLMSQNILSTAITTLGYDYNNNDKTGKYALNFEYSGFFPVFYTELNYGKSKDMFLNKNNDEIKFSYYETELNAGTYIPFDLSSGKYFRSLKPQIQFSYINLNLDDNEDLILKADNFRSVDYRLYGYNVLKLSHRDIATPFGQVFDFNYRHTPFDSKGKSELISVAASLYFPGLFKHHSLNIYSGYQSKTESVFHYSDMLKYTSGYSYINDRELKVVSFKYRLPLFYPDFNIGSLMYIKRFKGGLFLDYGEGKNHNKTNYYSSYGAELRSDMHLLRFLAPFDLGIKAIYQPHLKIYTYEFLFAIYLDQI